MITNKIIIKGINLVFLFNFKLTSISKKINPNELESFAKSKDMKGLKYTE